jgi:hypothetical protein
MAADLRLVADTAQRHPNELSIERLRDRLADRRLAGTRRADQREDRPGALVRLDPALLAELRDRDVLDDPVLDVLETRVVGVEDLAGAHGVEHLFGAIAPRHCQQPVEVAADHLRLGRALAHPLEARELLLGLLSDGLGHAGLFDLGAVLLDDRRVVLAELLPDRVHLLAQEVLALLLLHARVDVLADALPDLHRREPLPLQRERQLQPLGDVHGLEQLHLLREAQVRRVPRRVGERSRLADRADERLDAAVVAAQLEDLLDDGSVLGLELADPLVGPDAVAALLDLDEQPAARVGLRGAGDPAVEAFERNRDGAAGQPDAIGDARDRADGGVLALVLWHE